METIEYIDLGLPSGTLWATENADDEYYTFDEAVKKFGNQLLTRAQFCELVDYTIHEWDSEQKGMWFIGKNGYKVFFPAYGYRHPDTDVLYHSDSNGYYWSCSPYSASGACGLCFSLDEVDPSSKVGRSARFPVRCVKTNFK